MSERRTFLDELRQLDAATQAERLRPGAVHRIARRLDAELLQAELPAPRRRAWIPMFSFAAGAALVLTVFAFGEPELATRQEPAPAPLHASWQVGGDNCHVTRGPTELVLDGSCRVEPPRAGVVIESRATTRLRPTEGGVVLVDGTAMFEAMSAPEGVPWRVEVPGGVLELSATRLSVVVVEDRGHVDLLEGKMRFAGNDGRIHAVEPGERFRFGAGGMLAAKVDPIAEGPDAPDRGSAAASEPGVAEATADALPLGSLDSLGSFDAGATEATSSEPDAADQPALAAGERLAALERPEAAGKGTRGRGRGRPAPSSDELRRIVDQVALLRAQRQYQAAASLLRDALRQRLDRRTHEVLSYELGTILSTQLHDEAGACAHWQAHRQRFPAGRYTNAIERAEARLGCEGR
jgi:transmembrane sensor